MELAQLLEAAAAFQIRFHNRNDTELAQLRKEHWEKVAAEIERLSACSCKKHAAPKLRR